MEILLSPIFAPAPTVGALGEIGMHNKMRRQICREQIWTALAAHKSEIQGCISSKCAEKIIYMSKITCVLPFL